MYVKMLENGRAYVIAGPSYNQKFFSGKFSDRFLDEVGRLEAEDIKDTEDLVRNGNPVPSDRGDKIAEFVERWTKRPIEFLTEGNASSRRLVLDWIRPDVANMSFIRTGLDDHVIAVQKTVMDMVKEKFEADLGKLRADGEMRKWQDNVTRIIKTFNELDRDSCACTVNAREYEFLKGEVRDNAFDKGLELVGKKSKYYCVNPMDMSRLATNKHRYFVCGYDSRNHSYLPLHYTADSHDAMLLGKVFGKNMRNLIDCTQKDLTGKQKPCRIKAVAVWDRKYNRTVAVFNEKGKTDDRELVREFDALRSINFNKDWRKLVTGMEF